MRHDECVETKIIRAMAEAVGN
ncbi:hypothetical protein MES5069_360081 [Mesorhizobium escarrei]|uniref:Uncharacterized protein n=1 Tax=Mesorhizobium escarrei TaxID=666018 RepID=A0ABN8JY47_9HYPH|nr:hypothetical protein MES5069_360081 [Mesorhizobium escarrei]